MKFQTITQSFLFTLLALSLFAPRAQCQNSPSASVQRSAGRSLNVLVLGDSIMWGQGLRSENKSWYHLKIWLGQHTGRPVTERIQAHSGAMIEAGGTEESLVTVDGEVNVAVKQSKRLTLNSAAPHLTDE